MINILHYLGVLFLFIATIFLVVVSISTPVWNEVHFLSGTLLNQRFIMGNWGVCLGNFCTPSRLGYDLSFIENRATGNLHLGLAIVHGLTYALILNPIAAGFTFVAFLLSLSTHLALGIIASIKAFFAFGVTVLAFAIDLAMFIIARDRLNKISEIPIHTELGNAMWLILVAVILQLAASFLVCCTHKRNRRNRDPTYANDNGLYDPDSSVQTKRWWQKSRGTDGNGYSEKGNGYSNGSPVL